MALLGRLEKAIAEAFSTGWGTRASLRPEIADLFEHPQTGAISGVLRIHVPRRDGTEAVAFESRFDALDDEVALDDFLAEALSAFLAAHASWPR